MPFPADSEARTVESEAQSAIGTTIAQLFGFLRRLVDFGLMLARRLYIAIAEHPEAGLITIANLAIMFG